MTCNLVRRGASQPSIVLWLSVSLISMIVLQQFTAKPAQLKVPGESRGDMALAKGALPAELDQWKMAGFKPAPSPDELPEGQYWWVHQWVFSAGQTTAVVSFDQLGEAGWHELTFCYRNQNRSIEQRETLKPAEEDGEFVVARMRDEAGALAILVFSVFYEDGTWATSPTIDIRAVNTTRTTDEVNFTDRFQWRFAPPTYSDAGHERALQCQVLVSCTEPDVQSQVDSAVALHLATRKIFRQEWLTHFSQHPEILKVAH
jgi:hypothetical protein